MPPTAVTNKMEVINKPT